MVGNVAQRATTGVLFVALIGSLTTLPPLATDVALPGLPMIARALGTSDGVMQWSLSAFILAFGFGQLVFGPLSDRYGRRPLLFVGLGVFTVVGVACTFATNGPLLVALRFVQGFGACAGTVCARAIVQDVARGDRPRAAAMQGYLSAINSLAPIVAPLLGAAILLALSWRWLYGVLPLIGIALLALVALRLPETSPRTARDVFAAYARVVRLPRTMPLAGVTLGSFGAYFTLIASSPFVLVSQLHLASGAFAGCFALVASSLLVGATLTGRLAHRIGSERLFACGIAGMTVAGAAVYVVDAWAPSAAGFTATMMFFAFCFGIVVPSAFAAALHDAGASAGLAAGILGAAQMAGGAVESAIAPAIHGAPSTGAGLVVGVSTLGTTLAYLRSRRVARSSEFDELDER